MKTLAILLISLCIIHIASAQDIRKSIKESHLTYVFKLSETQAEKIYTRDINLAGWKYFENLVDSFDNSKASDLHLPVGHYLYAKTERNQLVLSVESVNNLYINVLNNNNDFAILLNDSCGIVDSAQVWLGCKKIKYNPETRNFRLSRTNRQGLLKVVYQGHNNFFNITATNKYNGFRYSTNKIMYQTPLKIIAIPVTLVFRFPKNTYQLIRFQRANGIYYYLYKPVGDIIKSINYQYPYGYIKGISKLFNIWEKEYESYVVFNKPIYRQGDTVYLKAWIAGKNLKPVKDSLAVSIYADKEIKLGWIKPYRPGFYKISFIITPNLGLKLDRNYEINFRNSDFNTLTSKSFGYEDYELKSTDYTLRCTKNNYHYGEPVSITCKGVDENGLSLPDSHVELILLKDQINEYYQNRVFVPDTLWKHNQNLQAIGETKIDVPESIFPDAAIKVKVIAYFRNSNNELVSQNTSFIRDNAKDEIVMSIENDSLIFSYLNNTVADTTPIIILQNNNINGIKAKLPCKFKLNPFVNSYQIHTPKRIQYFNVSQEDDLFECFSNRSADSIWFNIQNPLELPLSYTIFRNNMPIFRSNQTHLNYACKARVKNSYSASVQYIWAGEVKNLEYIIPYHNKKLTVKAYQPDVVYPGQTSKISIKVTDVNGNPVPDADITAYSFTSKFKKPDIPTLPDYSRRYNNRLIFNNFNSNNDFNQLQSSTLLNFAKWKKFFGLDTIEFYKFLFPKNGIYSNTFKRDTSDFAEISPFLVDSSGNLMPIYILYIDNKPVYYNITNNPKPYVFQVSEGYHQITFRTVKKEISLYTYTQKGYKKVISVNIFAKNDQISKVDKSYYLDKYEQNQVMENLLIMRRNSNGQPSYLKQTDYFEYINPRNYNYGQLIAGPFFQNQFTYNQPGQFSLSTNFEPNYEYDFYPNLVKMRTWHNFNNFNFYNSCATISETFNDSVYTLPVIEKLVQYELNCIQQSKPVHNNPLSTPCDRGYLKFQYINKPFNPDLQVKNYIVLSYKIPEFIRVYHGLTEDIHDLDPGYYQLIALLFNNQYLQVDSILIKPNGTNYCKFTTDKIIPRNIFIDSLNTLILNRGFMNSKYAEYQYNFREEQKRIQELALQSRVINYNTGNYLRGKILDAKTNEPIPGVTILINGTLNGVISDLSGNFSIEVPHGKYSVDVSFIGYKKENIPLLGPADITVALIEDVRELSEVVVIGYGTQNKADYGTTYRRELCSSITKVTLDGYFQGCMAGLDISGNAGSNTKIFIRGASSVSNSSNILFVLDGIPQLGDPKISPDEIESIEILKDEAATAIYGAKASGGAVVITRKNKQGSVLMKAMLQDNTFMAGITGSKSIRNHFSDYAFWKPDLTTDKNGLASFEVTFPDDITSWKTGYLVMGNKGACGQLQNEIKSFKPVASALALPRFLLPGDSCNIIGKALNYTSDSINIKTKFTVNNTEVFTKSAKILSARIDTFTLVANPTDSIKVKYQLVMDDGYSDGEERYIPVTPLGTTETVGNFYNLQSDTTLVYKPLEGMGKITLHAEADVLNILLDDIQRIRNYQHFCNEQLSSKLKSIIQECSVRKMLKKSCEADRDIRKIIHLLEDRRNNDSLWGWWANGQTQIWITLHVIEALKMAEKYGYTAKVDYNHVMRSLQSQFETLGNRDKLRAVRVFKIIDSVPDYRNLIAKIFYEPYDTVGRYELWELKQTCNLPFPMDSLLRERKTTIFGNYYWGHECYSLFDDATSATLVAYRILRKNNPENPWLYKIRNYFLERRNNKNWGNTWETSRVLETLLPDFIKNHELNTKPKLVLSGAITDTVTVFPCEKTINVNSPISFSKTGVSPIYFSAYQQFFNTNPEKISKDFIVNSYFEDSVKTLKAGTPINLNIDVVAKKSSEYVMIEIPIPGGCSYQSKRNYNYGEDYREYFRDRVCIYISRLQAGKHTYKVSLLPRYTGKYNLNPAKAELMYFPVFFGRDKMKKVTVKGE